MSLSRCWDSSGLVGANLDSKSYVKTCSSLIAEVILVCRPAANTAEDQWDVNGSWNGWYLVGEHSMICIDYRQIRRTAEDQHGREQGGRILA